MRLPLLLGLSALVVGGTTCRPALASPDSPLSEASSPAPLAALPMALAELSHLRLEPSAQGPGLAPAPPRSPWTSVALSAAGGAILSPLGLAAGYLYAGDPQRGVGVGLGGLGTMTLGVLAGYALSQAVVPGARAGGESAGFAYAFVGVPVMALSLVGYYAWALVDVYRTTIRMNEAAAPE